MNELRSFLNSQRAMTAVWLCSFTLMILLSACAGAGPGQELPSELKTLIGARGSSGEMALKNAGYEHRNTSKTESSSITHWRAKDGTCIEVTTTDGRYAKIDLVGPAKCEDDGSAVAASGAPGAMRTVCGVIVGGKTTRYICEVEEDRQGTTALRMPDTNIQLKWKPDNKVDFLQEGANPVEAKYSDSEGETDIVVDERTFFYISNPQAAALEVQNFKN